MNEYIIRTGEVVLVEGNDDKNNESDALRIKVRLTEDGDISIQDLPWCFQFLPNTFQTVPKEGEGVMVICSALNNSHSNRYYVGPIISQPQYNEYCSYGNGYGPAISLLQGGNTKQILKKISKNDATKNAFPNPNDVAVVGRKSEDVILRDGEIVLRCGIRSQSTENDKDLKGNVILNSLNPSYIQLKFKNGLAKKDNQKASSMINIVADKVNLMSNQVSAYSNGKDIIDDNYIDELMSKLHRLPYGDELVNVLETMRQAIVGHVHNFPGTEPPIPYGSVLKLQTPIDEEKLLSKDIRIS